MDINDKHIQFAIVIGFILLMFLALIIDGEFGERVFASLMAAFGLVLGYFFRKSQETKQTPTYIFEEEKKN